MNSTLNKINMPQDKKPKIKKYVWRIEFQPATRFQEEFSMMFDSTIETMARFVGGRHRRNRVSIHTMHEKSKGYESDR